MEIVEAMRARKSIRAFKQDPIKKEMVKEILEIAVGLPGWDFPANKLESTRELVDNITSWCGFK